jgi:hypothetical protein
LSQEIWTELGNGLAKTKRETSGWETTPVPPIVHYVCMKGIDRANRRYSARAGGWKDGDDEDEGEKGRESIAQGAEGCDKCTDRGATKAWRRARFCPGMDSVSTVLTRVL